MRHAVLNFIRVAANIISHYFHIARIKKKEKKQDGSTVRTKLVSECASAYFLEQHSGTMLQ